MNSMIPKTALLAAATAALVVAMPAHAGAPACKALVQASNDLYLAGADGSRLAQFSHDRQAKASSALSPDGGKAAFVPRAKPGTFVLVDRAGGRNFYPADKPDPNAAQDVPGDLSNRANAPLTGIAWVSDDTIRLEKHVGKDVSRFEFYRVPPNFPSRLQQIGRPALGSACTLAPQGNRTACLMGNDVVVNGEIVYSDPGVAGSAQQDSVALRVGGTTLIKDAPGLHIQVKSIKEGVTLRATLPTGNWIESRVEERGFMTIPLQTGTLRVFPTVTDGKAGAVRLDVRSSKNPATAYGTALAWIPNGNGVAVVKNTSAGSVLTLLQAGWKPAGEVALGINEPVRLIRFVQPALLYFETSSRAGVVPVMLPAAGHSLQVGAISALPKSLSVNGSSTKAPVLGWACE